MQACMALEECDVIEHLIDFTEAAASDPVILEQARMAEIPEEMPEPEPHERPRRHSSRVVETKESSKRDLQHPNPSLYVTSYRPQT